MGLCVRGSARQSDVGQLPHGALIEVLWYNIVVFFVSRLIPDPVGEMDLAS